MSIEAMKQALDVLAALDALFSPVARDSTQRVLIHEAKESIEALRTAIQQAESEPVGFVDFQGTVFWHDGPPPADSLLFAAKPVSHDKAKWCEYVAGMVFAWFGMQETLPEENRCVKAISGIIERRMWALPTIHPAPGVPDDSKRLDYLQDRGATIDLIPGVADFYPMQFRVGGLHSSANTDVRAAIDATMLASPAQKGGE